VGATPLDVRARTIATRMIGPVAVAAALLIWLWPIGVGGQMPAGGDVTHFFLGLMGFFSQSLREGRLPVWNDLWGYGFPGLAESQMGVYYPVHWVLYGLLSTEAAYTVSLIAHTLWGGFGVFWAARRMGISRVGSVLAAFVWSTSGFFLIHLAHPWGYTTGSWMPWALGLAWTILAPERALAPWRPLVLSAVLVLQLLPGHFQLAFETQFVIGLMVVWVTIEHVRQRIARRPADDAGRPRYDLRRLRAVVLALVAAFPLAALQVVPTARLAGLAAGQLDFEYLSGFAATPFHLVNFVAPGLFHRSPLWRPLVWDPFHTMPEELLGYVGLVPLFLAWTATVREFRKDAGVRFLAIVALCGFVLSFGPYAPGFAYLVKIPGFSFFRAPARWGLMMALALALLAGKGIDRWEEWTRIGRSLFRFVILATVWVLLTLGTIELALACTADSHWPGVTRAFQRAFRAMPWGGDPDFSAVMAIARQSQPDPRVPTGLALAVVLRKQPEGRVFVRQRGWIYGKELGETVLLLVGLGYLSRKVRKEELSAPSARELDGNNFPDSLRPVVAIRHRRTNLATRPTEGLQSPRPSGDLRSGGRRRPLGCPETRAEQNSGTYSRPVTKLLLVVVTFLDLWALGCHRLIDVTPLRPLVEQSPVLARLAREPRGTRIADQRLRNLPMLIGLAPISAYRTLDLPAVGALTALAQQPLSVPAFEPFVRNALRATGTSVRVFDPVENRTRSVLRRASEAREEIVDPALPGWLFGQQWAEEQANWIRTFRILWCGEDGGRAWMIPSEGNDAPVLDEWSGDPREILPILDSAIALEVESPRPEEMTIKLNATEPGWVVVSQLADPEWEARWFDEKGRDYGAAEILPTFAKRGEPGGWQRVGIPGPGPWLLRFTYEARDVSAGLAISVIAWTCWAALAIWWGFRSLFGERNVEPPPLASPARHPADPASV
jgi:hypothetical protein